jgi:hypothetical protein
MRNNQAASYRPKGVVMSSMQDAINAHLEELQAVVAKSSKQQVVQAVNGEVVARTIE